MCAETGALLLILLLLLIYFLVLLLILLFLLKRLPHQAKFTKAEVVPWRIC